MRIAVAAMVSLAAALFVAWWSRAAVVERDEARERAARLATPEIDPPEQLIRMRTDAHALLAAHCAPCHDSMATAPDAEALGVFDVQDSRWWLAMSDRQLRIVIDRMAGSEGMSPADIAGIESYVQAELDFRVGGPT
jgi:mono/diheme cytochrome c family protein